MSRIWLLPDHFMYHIDERVEALGERAFPHNGRAHYYSGPNHDVMALVGAPYDTNYVRGLAWAKKHGAMVIDDAPLGRFLNTFDGKGLFAYFQNNPHFTKSTYAEAALAPWRHLSRYYALSMWGYVSTTVCGASERGVYYQYEIPHTINPKHGGYSAADFIRDLLNPRELPIEYVNLVPFSLIKAAYTPTDWQRATRIVCLGEIRSAYHEAIEGSKPSEIRKALAVANEGVLSDPVEAYQYFLEVHDSYRIARDLMLKTTSARPKKSIPISPAERRVKRETRLESFGEMVWKTVEAELALMPPATRPRISIPPCLTGKVIA